MEGGFFDQLEFFPGTQEEKRVSSSCMPVVSTTVQPNTASDHLNPGIYPDEESVDFTDLLRAYNSETVPVSSSRSDIVSGNTTTISSATSFLTGEPFSLSHNTMYGSDGYHHNNPFQGGQVEMTPSPPSIPVECIGVPTTPSPHVVQIESNQPGNYPAMRPAPGKAQRAGKANKKHAIDKNTQEYRQKRDRNNIAVRKSREKSKIRVMDTERRVKDLEEENSQLQSKIALLTKELNVLKSLFTSAGVSQPPSLHNDEGMGIRK